MSDAIALCGDDASCRHRVQAHREHAEAAADDRIVDVSPSVGNWFCFRGPTHELGSCETTLAQCVANARASRDARVPIVAPCRRQRTVACAGVRRDEAVTLYCAPSSAACEAIVTTLSGDTDVEVFAACEAVD